MDKTKQILSDQELFDLTNHFQADYSKQRAIELACCAIVSMITEPGDAMAGALSRILGRVQLVQLLAEGLETRQVIRELDKLAATDQISQRFGALEESITDSRQRWLPRFSKSRLGHLFSKSKELGLSLVTRNDSLWPIGLNDLLDATPAIIYAQGISNCLGQLTNAVSVVGSRTFTSYGKKVTENLVGHLAAQNRITVSGGAVGIDAICHRSSLEKGLATVAVMAGGLDKKYPRVNFALFDAIQTNGALISELPPGVAPTRWRFLQRNRLIAALTPSTVVVEAAVRSGSIRTANNALELNRELFAVPGSVFSKTSAGTNALISELKAIALCDLEIFTSDDGENGSHQTESDLAKRALDAIRELGHSTKQEISKAAGLTEAEMNIGLKELLTQKRIRQDRNITGQLHYALKHEHRDLVPARAVRD